MPSVDAQQFRAVLLGRGWVEVHPNTFRRGDELVRVTFDGGAASAVHIAPGFTQAGALASILQTIVHAEGG